MNPYCTRYLFLILCIICCSLPAQSRLTNIADLPQLADNPIHKITQDPRGILWLATQKGIFQYNGFECKSANSPIDSVLDLCVVNAQVFFCTAHSIYTFSIFDKHFSAKKIADVSNEIKQLLPYQAGLVLAFADSGIMYLDTKPPYSELYPGLISLNIHCMSMWHGDLIAGNYEGLFDISRKNNQFSQSYFGDSSYNQEAIKSLYNFHDSLLFILDYNGIVTILDKQNQVKNQITIPEPLPLINGLLFENQDLILFSDNEVLRYFWDAHLWLRKDVNTAFENENGWLSMTQDKEGNIWLGSKNKGIYRYGLLVEKIPIPETNLPIFSVYSPTSQEIWYTNEKGVFRLTWQKGEMITTPIASINRQKIIATYLTGDAKGNIWIGTFDKGLFICSQDGKRVQHITTEHGLLNNNILHIFFDKEKVWLSTFGGVSNADIRDFEIGAALSFQNYTSQNGFNSNYTYQVAANLAHTALYFATEGKGAIQLANGQFTGIQGIPAQENVYNIFSDRDENLFFLTEKSQLFCKKIASLQTIDLTKSGKKDFIFATLDQNQDLLLGYKEGLMIMEKESQQFRDLGKSYNLGNLEPNMNGYANFVNNRILIGTNKGLLLYSPISIETKHQANIYLESVEVSLQSIDFEKDSVFSHANNDFSFHFHGVWLTEPEMIKYRYKLLGLADNWITTKDRFANFANLPPGKYTFIVQATIHHNFEDPKEVAYTFYIQSPFWATKTFIILTILGIIGIFAGIIRWREYALHKEAAIKKQQIEMELQILKNQINPHFLFNSLNTLVGIIEEAPKEAVNYVEHLSVFYRNILKYKEVDMISLKEEWNILQEYLYLLQTRFQDNITFDISIDEGNWEKTIPAFTLQMLLENAVKHNIVSKSKPLHIILSSQNDEFVIQNTYQPKQSILHSTGIGLQNINNRFLLLTQKAIQIEQTDMYFRIRLPLSPSTKK